MREHLFNKSPPHMANMAGAQQRHGQMAKGGGPLQAELPGDVFHADYHRPPSWQSDLGKSQSNAGEDMKDHDIISAIQHAHKKAVALWLAGSWRCNLGGEAGDAPWQSGSGVRNRRRHN